VVDAVHRELASSTFADRERVFLNFNDEDPLHMSKLMTNGLTYETYPSLLELHNANIRLAKTVDGIEDSTNRIAEILTQYSYSDICFEFKDIEKGAFHRFFVHKLCILPGSALLLF